MNARGWQVAEQGQMSVPLAVVTLLGSGKGLEGDDLYLQVKKVCFVENILEVPYFANLNTQGIVWTIAMGDSCIICVGLYAF